MVSAVLLLSFGTVRASTFFHEKLLCQVLAYPMHVFDWTPTGRLLGRFGRDIDTIDVNLRRNILGSCRQSLRLLTSLFVVSISMPWFLVFDGVIMIAYLAFQVVLKISL